MAIVAAGLWAFYTFVYQEKIKPASDPAALTLTVGVQRLGRDATRDILRINVRLQNSGKTEIDIAADAWNVWGLRYGTRDALRDRRSRFGRSYRRDVPVVSQTLIASLVEIRKAAVGGPPSQTLIIEPDATQPLEYIVVVPRGRYDVIHAQAIDIPVKTSDPRKVPVTVTFDPHNGAFLHPPNTSDTDEYDIETNFALAP